MSGSARASDVRWANQMARKDMDAPDWSVVLLPQIGVAVSVLAAAIGVAMSTIAVLTIWYRTLPWSQDFYGVPAHVRSFKLVTKSRWEC